MPSHALSFLQVDEEEREQLDAAVDAAMRHLDMTGALCPLRMLRPACCVLHHWLH